MKKDAVLVAYIRKQLASLSFKYTYRMEARHFSRLSKLGFGNTMLTVLRMVKKTIKVEIMDVFRELKDKDISPSRQAFAEAREKISYHAFEDFFVKSCTLALDDEEEKTYRDYRIFSVDGSSFIVGIYDKLNSFFGKTTTVEGKSMCRINGIVDVMSDAIVSAIVAPFSDGERQLAIRQIREMSAVSNALYLFDRGYWSPELVKTIMKNGQKFLMRLQSNVCRNTADDVMVDGCQLRRYTFTLPGGATEILVTNLEESEFSDDDLAELYRKRWSVETKYLQLKERMQINSLSGESVNVVLQDIYSTLLISNLVAFICEAADEEIAEKTAGKDNLYPQKANRSICLAALRRQFVTLCLLDDSEQMHEALNHLQAEIARCVTYVGKSKPRQRKLHKREKPNKQRISRFL